MEEARRKSLFLQTHSAIKKHNSKSNVTFQMNHNQFSDMVKKTFENYYSSIFNCTKKKLI